MFYEVILGKNGLNEPLTYSFDSLLEPGTLVEVPIGKTKIYQTNKQFPILKELQSIVIKSQKGSKPSKTIG